MSSKITHDVRADENAERGCIVDEHSEHGVDEVASVKKLTGDEVNDAGIGEGEEETWAAFMGHPH